MSGYVPVSCDLHSRLELAAMHHTRLILIWRDEVGAECSGSVMPLDLETKGGEEFLIAEAGSGEPLRIRLDRLISIEGFD